MEYNVCLDLKQKANLHYKYYFQILKVDYLSRKFQMIVNELKHYKMSNP